MKNNLSVQKISRLTIFVVVGVFLVSCAGKKNTGLSRAYHNLTARYNVYFNGKEAYNEGVKSIEESHKADYSRILPIFLYQDKEALGSASSNMDRAIEKSSKLITLHSITKKPKMPKGELSKKQKAFYAKKEYCNWIDDGYFLMGRAYFHKEDYYNANKNFEYVNTEYKNDPIRYNSSIWLARSKSEMGYPDDARLILDKLMEEGENLPENLYDEYYAIYADTYMQQDKFQETIEMLEKALEYTRKRKIQRRYTYILAQLYQELNDNNKAAKLFAAVIKMNPKYDMAFNAKINLATSYESNSGGSAELVKTLYKLLRDEKNIEFKDQIYFALANIYLKNGDTQKALENYKLSISKSESNNYQKSMSYLAIANIYFDEKKYIESQPFYDSCVTLLSSDYRNYEALKQKSTYLNELAENYNIVQREDSLQQVAKLSPKQRDAFIDDIIDAYKQEQERLAILTQEQNNNSMLYRDEFGTNNNKLGSTFYFYNQSAINFGKSEFRKKWGDRKLEDNWRRKNKSSVNDWEDDEFDEAVDSVETQQKTSSPTSRQFYLQDLPLTDSLMAVSNKKMEEAQFNVGSVFMIKFEYDNEAINAFEEYIARFPNGELASMVYYYLYRLYEKNNDELNSLKYKKAIISKFPESVFAKALTNPNYIKEHKNREAKIDKLYKNTYALYLKYNYPEVIANADLALQKYEESYLIPKFEFLKAMATGKMTSIPKLKEELIKLQKKYATDSVGIFAQKVLNYLEDKTIDSLLTANPDAAIVKREDIKEIQEEIAEVEIYFFNEEMKHKFVLAIKTEYVDMNRLRFNVINYNLDYFSNFDFKLEEKILNPRIQFLTIGPLSDYSQAMNYYELINLSNEIFEGLDKDNIEHFIISDENYKVLLKNGNLDKYMNFYYEYYSR